MAVAVYARVSTEEQQQRQSIQTQLEFAERYCALHELRVQRVYADEGVSGTVPLDRRAEGGQILDDAQLGKFDQLLVYKLDRLGRETRLILNAVADLQARGVRIRSMTEEFDTATPTGRLMLTLLSGFASHERDVIRERCVAGTLRVAEAGAWLGGIVPYGYRKVGEQREARLEVCDEIIPGLAMSEADVIREVFRMAVAERKSCPAIAKHLNTICVPCAYVRDDRLTLRGKRKARTSGVWRAGRVRGLLTNKTYMGVHEFGKRSTSGRSPISRPVPAIVTEHTWQNAQANLRSHFLFGTRNARNQYLLRGLIKCGLCGRTYIGVAANRPSGKREFYYRCNGAHSPSVYGDTGRCQSKAVRGDLLEQQVWSDVEAFLRNPEPVLDQLHARLRSDAKDSDQIRSRITSQEALLAEKATERGRVVGLYRRGRLSEAELDEQMEEIAREEATLEARIAELRRQKRGAESVGKTVGSAQQFLTALRTRLDGPVSWEQKRRLVEVLVAGGCVETVEVEGVRVSNTTVTYRFSEPEASLVFTQSYGISSTVRVPSEPQTVGDHIRRRRLAAKMLQKQVAELIGVDKTSIFNWEASASTPDFRYMPAIIDFLGYNPLPEAKTSGERLVRHRTTLGISQKEAALTLDVDPGTLARWERNERVPTGVFATRVKRFVAASDSLLVSNF